MSRLATEGASEPVAGLVIAAAAGDRDAEGRLCRRLAPAVRAFARRRVHATDLVDELTQDVMLVFVEALRRGAVEDPDRVGGFVLGICRNLMRDRARARERRTLLWAQFGSALGALEQDSPRVLHRQVSKLEDCLSQLAERARDVIRYAYVEGEDNVAIAARLALTEGNARVIRHRALAALRDCMTGPLSWEVA